MSTGLLETSEINKYVEKSASSWLLTRIITSVLSLATSITRSSPWIRFLSFLIIQCAVAKTSNQDRHFTVINTQNLKGQKLGMKIQPQLKDILQFNICLTVHR
jgi:hypothetical protein